MYFGHESFAISSISGGNDSRKRQERHLIFKVGLTTHPLCFCPAQADKNISLRTVSLCFCVSFTTYTFLSPWDRNVYVGYNAIPVCWLSFKNSKWLRCRYLVADLFGFVSHISLVNFLSNDSFSYETQYMGLLKAVKPYETQSSWYSYFRQRFFL